MAYDFIHRFGRTSGSGQKQWDYFSGSPSGAPLLDTEYTYDDDYSLPDNLTGVQVCDSTCNSNGSNTVSQTIYNYVPSATTTSGIVNHSVPSDTYLLNPYLGSVQQWISGSNSLTTTFTNDDTGAQLTSTDPNGQTTFSRDSTDSYVTTMTPPTPSSGVSLPQSATYDASTGLVTSTTDPNGETTSYAYDWAGRPLTINYPDGGSETFGYPPNTPPNTVVDTHTMNASESAQTQTFFDGYGRLSRVAVANGQATNPWYQTDSCYDLDGRLVIETYPYQGSGGAPGGQGVGCSSAGDTYSYDALGRMTRIYHADGTAITYAYTGRATQVTDENGVSRISQVDGLGRTTAVCEISSNGSMPGNSGSPVNCGLDLPGTGFLTTYTYSLAGHTVSVNQGGQTRSFQTDGVGRTVSVAEPESGNTTYSYAFNGTGLLVTRTRAQANQTNSGVLTTTTTQYDAVGRPVSVSYNDGITLNKYFVYDQSTIGGISGGTSTGAGKGRLTEMATTSEAEAFVYDPMGRVLNDPQCIPGGCASTSYYIPFSYDWMGNVTSADDGSGAVSTYTYSPASEVTSITSSLNDSTHQPDLVSNVLNGPDGPVSWQLGNGLSVLRLYDSLGRTQQEWVCNVTASVGCGGSGNVLNGYFVNWRGTQASYTSDTYFSQDRDYTYDDFNRLATMSDSDTGQQLYNWVYDRWGNRWQQNASTGGFSFLTSYNTSANQINVLGYTYDAAGNLMNDSTFAYTYDAEGNMLKFGPSDGSGAPVTYQYNALNQRVREDEDGNEAGYVFNPAGQRSTIWDMATGDETRGDTYWGNVPVEFNGEFDGSNQSNYVHRNWQNTETVITAADGLAEALYHYLPYGDFSGWNGTPLNPPAFAGMDEEYYNGADSGMDHAQFRQYHNWYARWLSPDPYSGSYDFSNPQSLNRYTYAMNNPLTFTDPSGLDGDDGSGDGACLPCDIFELGTTAIAAGLDDLLSDLFNGQHQYQGSFKPRPTVAGDPAGFGENLGLPTSMPEGNWGLSLALNLPSEGCEFGGCGGGSSDLGPGTIAVGSAATVGCVFAEPCGVLEGIGAGIAILGGAIGVEDIISQMSQHGRGNQADTGIEGEAQQLVAQGLANSICCARHSDATSKVRWKYGKTAADKENTEGLRLQAVKMNGGSA